MQTFSFQVERTAFQIAIGVDRAELIVTGIDLGDDSSLKLFRSGDAIQERGGANKPLLAAATVSTAHTVAVREPSMQIALGAS